MPPDKTADGDAARPVNPRDAASLVLIRGGSSGPEVLMGRRPLASRFMPGVYVFPGGAVDPKDYDMRTSHGPAAHVLARLGRKADSALAGALPWTALRETWEETGLMVGAAGTAGAARGDDACEALDAYAEAGLAPDLGVLDYLMRAVTPRYAPIRFNTRFFIADGAVASGAIRQVSELEDIGWRAIEQAMSLNIVNVTELVLTEAKKYWTDRPDGDPDRRTLMFTQHEPGDVILREE